MEELSPKQLAVIKFIFSRIFPLPFIVVGALLLYFGAHRLERALSSADWPSTNATVISSSMSRDSYSAARGRTQIKAEIHYKFLVQKTQYRGAYYRTSSNTEEPMRLVERHPPGKQITVSYMPGNPAENLLEPGLRAESLLMPLGGTLFLVAGILMAIYFPRAMKDGGRTAEGS